LPIETGTLRKTADKKARYGGFFFVRRFLLSFCLPSGQPASVIIAVSSWLFRNPCS